MAEPGASERQTFVVLLRWLHSVPASYSREPCITALIQGIEYDGFEGLRMVIRGSKVFTAEFERLVTDFDFPPFDLSLSVRRNWAGGSHEYEITKDPGCLHRTFSRALRCSVPQIDDIGRRKDHRPDDSAGVIIRCSIGGHTFAYISIPQFKGTAVDAVKAAVRMWRSQLNRMPDFYDTAWGRMLSFGPPGTPKKRPLPAQALNEADSYTDEETPLTPTQVKRILFADS